MIEIPAVVRNKARAAGANDWVDDLPVLLSELAAAWSIVIGQPYEGGSEAFVAEATRCDGTTAVLKVIMPGAGNDPSNEATVLSPGGRRRLPCSLRLRRGAESTAHGAARTSNV